MHTITREDVEVFTSHCIQMRSAYQYHRRLYESGNATRKLLEEVASIFFGDLNRIMREHIFLQISKALDPDIDGRGNKSLTVAFFMNCSDTYPQLDRLKVIGEQLQQFGRKIKLARHKIIAHLDRDVAINGEPLGAAPQEEWNQFWLNLQEFVHILYEHYLSDSHMYINGVGNTSEVDSLIKALEQSRELEKLLIDPEVLKKWADMKSAEIA